MLVDNVHEGLVTESAPSNTRRAAAEHTNPGSVAGPIYIDLKQSGHD